MAEDFSLPDPIFTDPKQQEWWERRKRMRRKKPRKITKKKRAINKGLARNIFMRWATQYAQHNPHADPQQIVENLLDLDWTVYDTPSNFIVSPEVQKALPDFHSWKTQVQGRALDASVVSGEAEAFEQSKDRLADMLEALMANGANGELEMRESIKERQNRDVLAALAREGDANAIQFYAEELPEELVKDIAPELGEMDELADAVTELRGQLSKARSKTSRLKKDFAIAEGRLRAFSEQQHWPSEPTLESLVVVNQMIDNFPTQHIEKFVETKRILGAPMPEWVFVALVGELEKRRQLGEAVSIPLPGEAQRPEAPLRPRDLLKQAEAPVPPPVLPPAAPLPAAPPARIEIPEPAPIVKGLDFPRIMQLILVTEDPGTLQFIEDNIREKVYDLTFTARDQLLETIFSRREILKRQKAKPAAEPGIPGLPAVLPSQEFRAFQPPSVSLDNVNVEVLTGFCGSCAANYTTLNPDAIHQLELILNVPPGYFDLCSRCALLLKGEGPLRNLIASALEMPITTHFLTENKVKFLTRVLKELDMAGVELYAVSMEEISRMANWIWQNYKEEILDRGVDGTWQVAEPQIVAAFGEHVRGQTDVPILVALDLARQLSAHVPTLPKVDRKTMVLTNVRTPMEIITNDVWRMWITTLVREGLPGVEAAHGQALKNRFETEFRVPVDITTLRRMLSETSPALPNSVAVGI